MLIAGHGRAWGRVSLPARGRRLRFGRRAQEEFFVPSARIGRVALLLLAARARVEKGGLIFVAIARPSRCVLLLLCVLLVVLRLACDRILRWGDVAVATRAISE
jgi:hypothetical protein